MPPSPSPTPRDYDSRGREDYLKRRIQRRPERAELIRMHILEGEGHVVTLSGTAEDFGLQKRARLADDLNEKLSQRPGPMELIHKNILPVHGSIKTAFIGELSSLKLDHTFLMFLMFLKVIFVGSVWWWDRAQRMAKVTAKWSETPTSYTCNPVTGRESVITRSGV
uniref:Phosphatase and actin regulator n=1 Tax=Periophthalmus magnuspinnatus TaxID=409849 RepID=A0A3B4B9G3_9GOBI